MSQRSRAIPGRLCRKCGVNTVGYRKRTCSQCLRAAQPCISCGAEKERSVKGVRKCDACRERDTPTGLCPKCGEPKGPGQGRRLCDSCAPLPVTPCYQCGSTAPKSVRGRRLCDDCQEIVTETSKARARAKRAMNRKPCEKCGKPKGPGRCVRLCPACRAEKLKPRTCSYCPRPVTKHKRVCETCQAETKRLAAQRNAKRAARIRAAMTADELAERRARHARNPRRPARPVIQGTVAAKPLADAIDRLVRLEQTGNLWDSLPGDQRTGMIDIVCERIGISSKSLREWRRGGRAAVQFDVADRALTRAGLAWWDVWPEGTEGHADAVAMFAGERVAA